MIRPKASVVQEDNFIQHLAGETVVPALDGGEDKFLTGPADIDAPRSKYFDNPTYAKVHGFFWGSIATVAGVLMYPISNSAGTCETNIPIFETALHKARLLFTPVPAIKDFVKKWLLKPLEVPLEELLIPKPTTTFSWGWLKTTTYDEKQCTAVNYLANLYKFIANHSVVIPVASAGVVLGLVFWKNKSIEHSVFLKEQELRHKLTDTYGQIATRLRSRSDDPKINDLCRKILKRQTEINKEIKAIGISSLKWQDIEDITHPVFDTCFKLTSRTPTALRVNSK